ncbi:hypothetical protein ABG854_20860 [Phocaeicola vulgatus]
MAFSKVAACCTDMVVFVRVTAYRFLVNKPMFHDFLSTFWTAVIPFAAKKYRITYLTMDITVTGSMWHRVVEVGTDWSE